MSVLHIHDLWGGSESKRFNCLAYIIQSHRGPVLHICSADSCLSASLGAEMLKITPCRALRHQVSLQWPFDLGWEQEQGNHLCLRFLLQGVVCLCNIYKIFYIIVSMLHILHIAAIKILNNIRQCSQPYKLLKLFSFLLSVGVYKVQRKYTEDFQNLTKIKLKGSCQK